MSAVPLTVIGGFLGAGKTTLVNHLLRTGARRYGVLVNDFGAVNIDAALIASRSADTIALTNGCVCCGIGDDLGAGLARLPAGIEHVIVEASGVADPWRMAQLALVEPGFALEPIVVLADASALAGQLEDRWIAGTVRGQLLAAEIVVLNKTDRAMADCRASVACIRPGIPIVETLYGRIDPAALRFPSPGRPRFHADRPAGELFRTLHHRPPGSFDSAKLRAMLLSLPAAVLRVKGFCVVDGTPRLLQFAGGQWSLTPSDAAAPGLVFIGTPEMPDNAALAARLDAALASG